MQLLNLAIINVPLIVEPPSWKTWWIYSICIIVAALTIYYYIRKRMSDAADDQRILREKVRDKTRELEQQKERAEDSEKAKEQLSNIL